eukprot:1143089-Pelagomonas_calceolata.AAC.11
MPTRARAKMKSAMANICMHMRIVRHVQGARGDQIFGLRGMPEDSPPANSGLSTLLVMPGTETLVDVQVTHGGAHYHPTAGLTQQREWKWMRHGSHCLAVDAPIGTPLNTCVRINISTYSASKQGFRGEMAGKMGADEFVTYAANSCSGNKGEIRTIHQREDKSFSKHCYKILQQLEWLCKDKEKRKQQLSMNSS